jgi:hypothetical protein
MDLVFICLLINCLCSKNRLASPEFSYENLHLKVCMKLNLLPLFPTNYNEYLINLKNLISLSQLFICSFQVRDFLLSLLISFGQFFTLLIAFAVLFHFFFLTSFSITLLYVMKFNYFYSFFLYFYSFLLLISPFY